jgi:anti-anti-sigma factor
MDGASLTWSVEPREGVVIVRPSGRVDESTAVEFTDRLGQEVDAAGESGRALLALSLRGVEYMSSRGLRALTLAQRRGAERGVRIALSEPTEVMREILTISRYDMVFPVFATTDEALLS